MKKTLNLEEEQMREIHEETALMENGLELDSIDALELVVGVEKEFGIKIQSSEEATKAFSSFGAFVDYVENAMAEDEDAG